jgi:hypothetical protein
MKSLTSYDTLKDGFKIAISKSDTELTIEAEDQGSGNTFSAKFTEGTIKTMSLELFENIPELFEGLVTAFKGLSEDPSVRIDPNGTIFFTQKLNMGKQEKSFNFPIPLKLAEVNPINRLEKVMIKVLKEVEGLREEVKGLNNQVFELNRENRQLQEKFAMDYYEIIYPTFDISGTSIKEFEISKDKKLPRNFPTKMTVFFVQTQYYQEKETASLESKLTMDIRVPSQLEWQSKVS